jgi:hypothetical protein
MFLAIAHGTCSGSIYAITSFGPLPVSFRSLLSDITIALQQRDAGGMPSTHFVSSMREVVVRVRIGA